MKNASRNISGSKTELSYARIMYFTEKETEALALTDEVLQTVRSSKIKVKLVEALLFKIMILGRKQRDG